MKIEQIYTGCIAHAAYYLESNGEAAIFDPLREVQPYIDKATKEVVSFLKNQAEQVKDDYNKIKQVARWTMALQLQGQMPSLPSQNSSLRATLMASKDYMDGLMEITDVLGAWIESAQNDGFLNAELPPIAVLYTLFARACDPVLEFLQMSELYSDEQILDMVMSSCFNGLAIKK